VRASDVEDQSLTNVILIASNDSLNDISYPQAPRDGMVLTDDLNPAEIFFEQARAGYFFR
jgi:hypothetical protein